MNLTDITLNSDINLLRKIAMPTDEAIRHILESARDCKRSLSTRHGIAVVSDGNLFEVWQYRFDISRKIHPADGTTVASVMFCQDSYSNGRFVLYPRTVWGRPYCSWTHDLNLFLRREVGKSFE